MATTNSLQAQFHQLFNGLRSYCADLEQHSAVVKVNGVNAQEQRETNQKTNNMIVLVNTSLSYPNMSNFWKDHRPTATYDPIPDINSLLADMKELQLYVFTGTPQTDPPNEYIKDTQIFMDGYLESELPDPHTGDHIITYGFRQYTPTQAVGYTNRIDAITTLIHTIIDTQT